MKHRFLHILSAAALLLTMPSMALADPHGWHGGDRGGWGDGDRGGWHDRDRGDWHDHDGWHGDGDGYRGRWGGDRDRWDGDRGWRYAHHRRFWDRGRDCWVYDDYYQDNYHYGWVPEGGTFVMIRLNL